MERLYRLAGNTASLLDRLVEQKEAFARIACLSALQAATGVPVLAGGAESLQSFVSHGDGFEPE